MQCTGCEKPATEFQCPLCQAEGSETEGFFCSQACFQTNWLSHRDGAHKGGTVKAGSKRRRDGDAATPSTPTSNTEVSSPTGKKEKKAKKESTSTTAATSAGAEPANDAEASQKIARVPAWPIIPVPTTEISGTAAVIAPSLSTQKATRAVIAVAGNEEPQTWQDVFWTQCAAMMHLLRKAIPTARIQPAEGERFVIVAGSPITAHAVAWVARCAGLAPNFRLVLSMSDEDLRVEPSSYFVDPTVRIVITCTSVIRHDHGKKASANASLWFDGRTLLTSPDVAQADDLQTLQAKAFFFVHLGTAGASFTKEDVTHHVALFPASTGIPSFQAVPLESFASFRFDNDLSTLLARGELLAALERVVQLYSNSKARCEECLTNALLADWGNVLTSPVMPHHKIAYMMRYLCDHSDKFAKSSLTLSTLAVRACMRAVQFLPPIPIASKASDAKNVSLVATVVYLFSTLSSSVVDSLGAAWGYNKIVEGMERLRALETPESDRKKAAARIESRYGGRLGRAYGQFLISLMHHIYHAVSVWALSVEEVDSMTLYSATLAHEAGPIRTFLKDILLLGHSAAVSSSMSLLTQRQEKFAKEQNQPVQASLVGLVHPATRDTTVFPTSPLPLHGRRGREIDSLQQMAIEEILMAMPKQPLPMYLGDVGNLIGIWTKFNAKYQGVLGYTLSDFLERNPEHFRVVGNVVTRLKAGMSEQVRVRFDQDKEEDSDDENAARKARDREALTGANRRKKAGKKEPVYHSAKARKKAAKKERNAARYNKNRQVFDPSKKVPGYIKAAPRKLKGRGRKANIRNFKRGE